MITLPLILFVIRINIRTGSDKDVTDYLRKKQNILINIVSKKNFKERCFDLNINTNYTTIQIFNKTFIFLTTQKNFFSNIFNCDYDNQNERNQCNKEVLLLRKAIYNSRYESTV